ncbi:MAG: GMC oxidoreductase [Ilumatobacteraceae bacterium]
MPSLLLARGAQRLGWRNDEIPLDALSPRRIPGWSGPSEHDAHVPSPALAAGARLRTGVRIDRLELANGRVTAATGTAATEAGPVTVRIRCRDVFVCGGAIQTPALLQRSGVRRNVGRSLAIHPTVKLAARFAEAINVPDDVPVHQVKEFAPGLSFGGSASNPGLVALALSDGWRDFSAAVEQWQNIAVYYAAITSEGRGRVVSVPGMRDPLVTYRLTAQDRALLGSGLGRLAHTMLAAGAEEVYPSFRGAPPVRTAADLAAMNQAFAVSRASVMTVHLCSTVPMGERTDRCGADSFGRVHGYDNLRVNDASLLPDAPGVNPQGSIMAIAIRNIRRFLEER